MALTNHGRNQDGLYGPTINQHYYQSKQDHRKSAVRSKHKHRWSIQEGQEYSVFKPSCEFIWFCEENECLFSIVDNGSEILGMKGERIAKFPKPVNQNDPWHGYPVFCTEAQNTPSDSLLDKLVDEKVITAITRKRIERRQI